MTIPCIVKITVEDFVSGQYIFDETEILWEYEKRSPPVFDHE